MVWMLVFAPGSDRLAEVLKFQREQSDMDPQLSDSQVHDGNNVRTCGCLVHSQGSLHKRCSAASTQFKTQRALTYLQQTDFLNYLVQIH